MLLNTHTNWTVALWGEWRRKSMYKHGLCVCVCALTGHQGRTRAAAASSPAGGTQWCRRSSHQSKAGLHVSSVPIATPQMTTAEKKINIFCHYSTNIDHSVQHNGCETLPRLTWWWTCVSADFPEPSTWLAASLHSCCGRCNILYHRRLWRGRSLPPSQCSSHPAWSDNEMT